MIDRSLPRPANRQRLSRRFAPAFMLVLGFLAAPVFAGAPGSPTLTPTPFNYGNVTIGATSAIQVYTLNNPSPDTLTITLAALGGAAPGQYALVGNTCTGAIILPGGSCTMSVRFAPTNAGIQAALVRVAYTAPPPNPPGGSELNATMLGNGVPPAAPALPAPALGPIALAISTMLIALFGWAGLRRRRTR